MTTLELQKSIDRSPTWRSLFLLPLVLVCFACLPSTQAVTPTPDGGYPGYNTAKGLNALAPATPGVWNTAIGAYALASSAPGGLGNTAVGLNSLRHNTTGTFNSALGVNSLLFNSIGDQNVAIGYGAQDFNTDGNNNTAVGFQASFVNTTGDDNVAIGWKALFHNTTSGSNTAVGRQALFSNTTGPFNTAMGLNALANNTAGSGNIALGTFAGVSLTTGDFNIDIGNNGAAADANTIRIGTVGAQTATFIAGISGATVPGGVAVIIDANGHLGTTVSSARFKDEIKLMDKASEAILALKPVTFCYKKELDPNGIPQFGLVAEEVEEVNPDLVDRDAKGELYTVRYEAVNAMLLNEFLKQHRKVEEQEATIAQSKKDFQSKLADQQNQIKALASGLEKVSTLLEVNKPAPQVVRNNQ